MKVQISFRGVERTPSLVDYVTRMVYAHLNRFGRQVRGVKVRISDVNGPKEGIDKRCQLTVAGPRLGALNLAVTHAEVLGGTELALERLAQVVERSLGRAQDPLTRRAAGSAA